MTGARAIRRIDPPWWVWALLVGVILVILVGGASVLTAFAAIHRQNAALIGSCERLQRERERINIEEARSHIVLEKANRRYYRPELHTTFYSPPADCSQATEHPEQFRAPPQVPFYRLPGDFPQRILQAAETHKTQPEP